MTKETVRYPDEVVDAVEDVIEDGVFESKSEFYRFSAEYVLDQLVDGYEPESFDYEEIVADLEADQRLGSGTSGDEGDFLSAVIEVRKRSLRQEFEAAEAVVDERYASHERESILLEELLDRYRAD